MEKIEYQFPVCVRCMTYNQASFIEDAMDGFTMQKTDFPFVCIVVDDASTDGEPEVIGRYLATHFDLEEDTVTRNEETEDYVLTYARHKTNRNCFFVVLLLKYNHFKKKPKDPYFREWTKNITYVALCEGDDFWTDPYKLQKQVNILNNHADVTLCSTACYIKTDDSLEMQRRYDRECIVPTQDIIIGGGLWLHTVTFFYRKSLLEDYPDYCKACHVGDYPLILWASLNGSVYYLPVGTSVYRYQSSGSWTSRIKSLGISPLIRGVRSEVNMLKGLDEYSGGKYSVTFNTRIRTYLYDALINHPESVRLIIKEFHEEVKLFTLRQKVHVFCIQLHIEPVYSFFWNRWQAIKSRVHGR